MTGRDHIRAIGPERAAQNREALAAESRETPENEAESGVASDALDLGEFAKEAGDDQDFSEEWDDAEEVTASRFGWVAPAIAITLIAGWTLLYVWAMQDRLLSASSAAPAEWTRWIIDWSVPVLLVGVGWLLTMRHSRAEAKRFAETAALLSQESTELESRLTVVNRELSLAREFLSAQSRELDSLGRIASERISTHASELQGLIRDNGAQVDRIGSASETALTNMARLRDDLPVIANSARDVANQVGNAGRTAHEQLDKLVSGFERLNQFGKASETQVASLDKRVGAILEGFENQLSAIETVISARLETVQAQAGSYRNEVDEAESRALEALRERSAALREESEALSARLREAEDAAMAQLEQSRERFQTGVTETVEKLDRLDAHALAASQKRIKELHEEALRFDEKLAARDRHFLEEVTRRQEEFETREAQASEVLAQRLADLDDALAERREKQVEETAKLVEQSTAMSEQLDRLSALIGKIEEQGDATRAGLSTGLEELGAHLSTKREELELTEAKLAELTEAGIRLLEIIQSGAQHSREDLPSAIDAAVGHLGSVEERVSAVSGMMLSTSTRAEGLSDYLVDAQARIEETDGSLGSLQARLAEQCEEALARIEGLRGGFRRLNEESDRLADGSQAQLREALVQLEDATRSAFAALEEGTREKVGVLAQEISHEAVTEIERALRNDTAETVGKLEQAAAHASGVGREATAQLRDQLAKVNELTVNLEQRIARAHEQAEEKIGNDFARRMALITDSLNSSAIDISSALSSEVADTAWDAYLKGDRGIFTRRAVRLIDNAEAREIAELYQNDDDFKANVARYIHDFEAMLRAMLSTRDGNALSVTLLGSDIGKLYVVLAQAIERLRQ
ncbi:ATPase [Qipengyuania nanhaisediminis]|uniref:ATPase n=1 Tax=Qipengyuania nanhaisediminis TaxID=604088 RepID=UPI0038B3118F